MMMMMTSYYPRQSQFLALLALFLLSITNSRAQEPTNAPTNGTSSRQDPNTPSFYSGCDIEDYYAGLLTSNTDGTTTLRDDVTRQDLEELLWSTHRKVLPYTDNNRDDVWKALMDLDAGGVISNQVSVQRDSESASTVHLIYSQVDVPARPYGTAATWNREHLWPSSRGVEHSGADFTDVHHIRPADWSVNAARNNLYFGSCGLVQPEGDCKSPAHEDAANDTAKDSHIFVPPAVVRGDIARALLYMDVRYSNQNNDGIDLKLTDCPTNDSDEMAYKSQLLAWHMADKVTEKEKERNQQACQRWQGNRNPFVDFPELAERYFGTPQTPSTDGTGYPSCSASSTNGGGSSSGASSTNGGGSSSSSSSTSTNGDGEYPCDDFAAGDVLFISMHSDNPDLVALVTLKDLPEGLVLYLTDNAWTGSKLLTNEGTIQLRVPESGIAAGTVFGYGATPELLHSSDWESVQGLFSLSASGDNLFLYCRGSEIMTKTEEKESTTDIRFLAGLDYSGGGWAEANMEDEDEYGTSGSALPEALEEMGAVTLPHFDDYWYVGMLEGSVEQLQGLLTDPEQWNGYNDQDNDYADLPLPTYFLITATPVSLTQPTAGDVMVVAMSSDDPDMVAMVALKSLPGGTQLYMTDNAWTGEKFLTNEGTLTLTLPPTGLSAGTIFGYGGNLKFRDQWQTVGGEGQFALAETGDTIIIYTMVGDNLDQIEFLSAYSFAGVDLWRTPGLADDKYGTADSALPESLAENGAVSLPHYDNYIYEGPIEGEKRYLQNQIQNMTNWDGFDTSRVEPPVQDFFVQVPVESTSAASTTTTRWVATSTLLACGCLAQFLVVGF